MFSGSEGRDDDGDDDGVSANVFVSIKFSIKSMSQFVSYSKCESEGDE